MIRLVALDLDRTLVGPSGVVSERNRKSVNYAMSRGVTVTLATGRRFVSAAQVASQLGLHVPLITFGGAYVADWDGSRVYDQHFLEPGPTLELLQYARSRGLVVNAYTDQRVYSTRREAALASGYWRPEDVDDFNPANPEPLQRLLQVTAVGREAVESLDDLLVKRYTNQFRYDVFSNQNIWTGHLLNRQASKGRALARLAERLGVEREEVLAVGDECNDVDMIAWAGVGVAMYYATNEVHAVADDVSPGGDPDGVAAVLYKYLDEPEVSEGDEPAGT